MTVLPLRHTRLIGRDADVAAIRHLLAATRLLTLTGSGGTGKTRLALQVAADLQPAFSDGVVFVSLAPLSDPALVLPAIAAALGVRLTRNATSMQEVQEALAQRYMLLVLDNFEHVLAAAPEVAGLLAVCPHLHVLITSREALRIGGEQEFPVPPLALPDAARPPTADELADVPATALFIERAHAANPAFHLTDATAPVVAAICTRLDGLPLAIELAAVRIKILSPEAMLARLDHRLHLLTGGPRDLPARQQTLRATIEWSSRLLDAHEQQLFTRLAIFAGGFSLEAAEAVANAAGDFPLTIMDGVASLVDKSLLRRIGRVEDEPRFDMLETIREFALERLAESGEDLMIARAHAEYVLTLVESVHPDLFSPAQAAALARLDAEYNNIRAALTWVLRERDGACALRFVTALNQFWSIRGYFREGRSWTEEALAGSQDAPPSLRANAFRLAGYLTRMLGDAATARLHSLESLALYRALGDDKGIAQAFYSLALNAQYQGDHDTAITHHREAHARARAAGDLMMAGYCLGNLGEIAQQQGDYDSARTYHEECLALLRTTGDYQAIAYPLNNLGVVAREQGDPATARRYLEESLAIRRALNERRGLALTLHNLGLVARDEGDDLIARARHEESVTILRELGDRQGIARALTCLGILAERAGDIATAAQHYEEGLREAVASGERLGMIENVEGFARIAGERGDTLRAVRLWAAAGAMRDRVGTPLPLVQRADHERALSAIRDRCGRAHWATAWAEGTQMTLEQTVTYARQAPSLPREAAAQRPAINPAGLSAREVEVLQLLAAGRTNQEIADTLFLSVHTVRAHLRSILTKTDTNSRAAAVSFAFQQGLV